MKKIAILCLVALLFTVAVSMPVAADGKGAIRGKCDDSNAQWLGEITYLANRSGGHLWFTPTTDGGPYIAGHSYHNVYKLKVGDPSEWCIVPSVPNRMPYNIIAQAGKPVYYKIFDTTTDTQVCP